VQKNFRVLEGGLKCLRWEKRPATALNDPVRFPSEGLVMGYLRYLSGGLLPLCREKALFNRPFEIRVFLEERRLG
jgi:hypothetical protein